MRIIHNNVEYPMSDSTQLSVNRAGKFKEWLVNEVLNSPPITEYDYWFGVIPVRRYEHNPDDYTLYEIENFHFIAILDKIRLESDKEEFMKIIDEVRTREAYCETISIERDSLNTILERYEIHPINIIQRRPGGIYLIRKTELGNLDEIIFSPKYVNFKLKGDGCVKQYSSYYLKHKTTNDVYSFEYSDSEL